ncbi:hypothetical protein V8F20_006857 [Naviculisporaceae sp. PSN 640]
MALPAPPVQTKTGDQETVHGSETSIQEINANILATLKKTVKDTAAWAQQMRSARDRERETFESQMEIATWNLNSASESIQVLRERLQASRMECATLREEIARLKLLLQSKGDTPSGEVERLQEALRQLQECKQNAKERNLYLTKRFEDIRKKYQELRDYDRTMTGQLEAAHDEIRLLRQGLDNQDEAQGSETTNLQVPIILPDHINVIKRNLELAAREIESANSRIDSIRRPGTISLLAGGNEKEDAGTNQEAHSSSPGDYSPRQQEGQLEELYRESSSRTNRNNTTRRNSVVNLDGPWEFSASDQHSLIQEPVAEQTEPLISFGEEQSTTQGQGKRVFSRFPVDDGDVVLPQARQPSVSEIEDESFTLPRKEQSSFDTVLEGERFAQTGRQQATFSLLDDEQGFPPSQGQSAPISLVDVDEDIIQPGKPQTAFASPRNEPNTGQSGNQLPAQSLRSPKMEQRTIRSSPAQGSSRRWEVSDEGRTDTEPLTAPPFDLSPKPVEDNGIPFVPKPDFSSLLDDTNHTAGANTQPKLKRVSFNLNSDGEDEIDVLSPESFSTLSFSDDSPSPQINRRVTGSNRPLYDKEICGFYRNVLHEIEEIIENRDHWNWFVYAFEDSLVSSTHRREVLKQGHRCFLCPCEMIGGEGARWKGVSIRDRKLRARSKFFGILYDMLLAHCEWTKADEGVDIILGHINQPFVGPTEIKSWVDTTYNYLPSAQPGAGKAVEATRRIFEYFQPILSPAATRDDRGELLKRLSKLCHATHELGKRIYKSHLLELRKVDLGGKDAVLAKASWIDPKFMEGKFPGLESTAEDWTGNAVAYALSAAVLKHEIGSRVVVLEKAQVIVKPKPGWYERIPLPIYPLLFILYSVFIQ